MEPMPNRERCKSHRGPQFTISDIYEVAAAHEPSRQSAIDWHYAKRRKEKCDDRPAKDLLANAAHGPRPAAGEKDVGDESADSHREEPGDGTEGKDLGRPPFPQA